MEVMLWQRGQFASGFRNSEWEMSYWKMKKEVVACRHWEMREISPASPTDPGKLTFNQWGDGTVIWPSLGNLNQRYEHETCCPTHFHRWSIRKTSPHFIQVVWRVCFLSDVVTKNDHRWRVLGVQIQPGNEDTKLPVENTHFIDTKKGTSIEITCEGHVDCVLQCETNCSFWICFLKSNS
jgi:hypothetical protein